MEAVVNIAGARYDCCAFAQPIPNDGAPMPPAPLKDWMQFVPEADLATYRAGGFLGELALGERTALIVVDVTMGFCGSPGLSLEQAIAEFATACGPVSWETMPRLARLIELFRARK